MLLLQELPSTTEEVNKQMRAVKKKLNAIAELEERAKTDDTLQLSVEQKDKMSKKSELFAEYAHLEQLLVRCQVRERAAEKAPSEDHSSISGEKADRGALHTAGLPQPTFTTSVPSTVSSHTTPTVEKLLVPSPKPADRNAVDIVSTSTEKATKQAKKGKVKGISLQEFNTILESSSNRNVSSTKVTARTPGDYAAWGRSLDANKTTASVSLSATLPTSPTVWSGQTVPTPVALATDGQKVRGSNHKAASPAPSVPSVPAVVIPAVSTDSPLKTLKKVPGTVPQVEPSAPRRARALLDFLPAATAVAKGLAPATPPPAAKAGWAVTSPAPSATTKFVTPAKSAPAASATTSPITPVRFSDIQRTEETARQSSTIATLQGNSRPWFVERHQRASSIEEVVRQQALDRAEEEEIARQVAEIDRVSLLAAKAKALKNGGEKSAKTGQGCETKKKKKLGIAKK